MAERLRDTEPSMTIRPDHRRYVAEWEVGRRYDEEAGESRRELAVVQVYHHKGRGFSASLCREYETKRDGSNFTMRGIPLFQGVTILTVGAPGFSAKRAGEVLTEAIEAVRAGLPEVNEVKAQKIFGEVE